MEEQYLKKSVSAENLKFSTENFNFLKNEDSVLGSDGKNKILAFNYDSENKETNDKISSFFFEKHEVFIQNFFDYLNRKSKLQKKNLLSLKKYRRIHIIKQIYDNNDSFYDKNSLLAFKYSLKSTYSSGYQRKKIEFSPYEENRRKAQNFKLKKSKEIRKKETILIKSKILKKNSNENSASKLEDLMKNSLENSSNNDSFFNTGF